MTEHNARPDRTAATPARGHAQLAPDRPTIFIECTHTFHSDLNTGIQRVVRNVLRHAGAVAAGYGFDVVPVIFEHNRLICADIGRVLADKIREAAEPTEDEPAQARAEPPPPRLAVRASRHVWRLAQRIICAALPFARVRLFVHAPPNRPGLAWYLRDPRRVFQPLPVEFQQEPIVDDGLDRYSSLAGCVLLLLDSSWTYLIWPAANRFKARGGKVAGVIYDLIPLTHQDTSVPELVAAFRRWFDNHLRTSDAFIAISRATADDVRAYMNQRHGKTAQTAVTSIGYFHLGSELDLIDADRPVRPDIRDLFASPDPSFLMVGSIEPRKNHAFALDAFDRYWAAGGSGRLVIVGRNGWKTEAFLKRAAEHPLAGTKLFVIRDMDDAGLDHAYHHASALVIASVIEGFGLPVVEAFQRGLPVICSDIPVFREIAEGRARFFSLADPASLTAALFDFAATPAAAGRVAQPWLTWRESTEQLFAALAQQLHFGKRPIEGPHNAADLEHTGTEASAAAAHSSDAEGAGGGRQRQPVLARVSLSGAAGQTPIAERDAGPIPAVQPAALAAGAAPRRGQDR